jgi:hypothetical protein
MNIFVTSSCPDLSARVLPDKHIVKMPIESAQMLAIAFHEYGYGTLPKKDGTPYDVSSKSRRNHPCTKWVIAHPAHILWLIRHADSLCAEYTLRYNKFHSTTTAIQKAAIVMENKGYYASLYYPNLKFVRSMPDDLKYDESIDTPTAYKKFLNTKTWVTHNYLRLPERKPEWIL